MGRIKVIYIAGAGRSGTTVLDNVLGQVNGLFSGGELHHIWKRGFVQNRLCGCGDPFASCELWSSVAVEALDGVSQEQASRLSEQVPRTREMFGMLTPGGIRRNTDSRRELLDATLRLYSGVLAVSGDTHIVDSSKLPAYGLLLATIPEFEVHVVHMIRDPRAVAFSWGRKKLSPAKGPNQYMRTHGPLNSAVFWDLWNLQAELLRSQRTASYTRLRYEDFVAFPNEVLLAVAGNVGINRDALPPISNGRVSIKPTHTVSGNPSRFETGSVELRLDSAWAEQIRPGARQVVNALDWPLMGRYGYRLRR